MQTLETMVVSPSTSYAVNQMPEGQQAVVGWTQAYVQPSLEQAGTNPNPYLMNVLKPDQARVRVLEQPQAAQLQQQPSVLPPTNPASVITATYNPTYNRCLPKILSDLDCEMKIKQVLKCIENILLDGSDMDPQLSYKTPDRSSSPQLAPKKKIKVKDDEEMPAVSLNGSVAGAAKLTTNKSPVRINVKVEPFDTEKAQRGPAGMMYPDQGAHQVPSTTSPRALSYDFPGANRMQTANNFPKTQQPQQQRAFSFEPYTYSATNPPNSSATQFMQQAFLQQHPQMAQHPLLIQQQLQAMQQHITQQQQLLNGAMLMHQQNPQHNIHYPVQAVNNHAPAGDAVAPNQPQAPENAFGTVPMDEFPFPVFSNTILEEVNQFKSAETKKPDEAAAGDLFFFGNPNPNNLVFAQAQALAQAQAQAQAQAHAHANQSEAGTDGAQEPLRLPNPLGNSSLLSHASLPLLFQMPQLTGLEEDDKWILSLLNIDGHENLAQIQAQATTPAPGF